MAQRSAATRHENTAPWLARLRAQLRAAGYTSETLGRMLGITCLDDVGVLNHAASLHRVARERGPAATLIRLFFLEADEPLPSVRAALTPAVCAQLTSGGLLQRRGDLLRARLRIDPVGDHYFVCDRRFHGMNRQALHLPVGDPVYPASSDSLLLRDAITASGAARVLDLCTGSGIHAVQRAAGAARVVAVDINRRAAAVAQLNAHLNDVSHVEVRVGDLYAPVRGEQFDLIIANPPFVASPYAQAPSYHSGGPTGTRVLRRVIAGLARHLCPGGRAFAVAHVAVRTGEDVQTVAARWFRDFPGRALVLVVETGTPVDLAAAQSLFALDRGLRAYAAEVARWVVYLRRHRIATVGLMLIAAERGTPRSVEVVEARTRVLPIPLSAPPAARIASWLNAAPPPQPA